MATIDFKHTPFGELAIISMRGCEDISKKVDGYLMQWRETPVPLWCPWSVPGSVPAKARA